MDPGNGNNRKSLRIRHRFIISAVIIVVLLIVIPLVTVYLLTQAYDESIRKETSDTSYSMMRTIRSFMEGAYNLSYELSANPGVISMDADVQAKILADCAQRNDYIELLYITGMDGMQTARSTGELGDRSSRWWFIRTMQDRQPFISASYYSVSTGKPTTAIFIPIYDGAEMIGIYGADLSLVSIQGLVDQFTDLDLGRHVYVIDGEGNVLAHHDSYYLETLTNYKTLIRTVPVTDWRGNPLFNPDGSVRTMEEEFSISDRYNAAIKSVMDGNIGLELIEEDGIVYYMSYEPINLPGYSDSWSVITLQNRSIAMEVVFRLVTQQIILALLIFIVFIALGYSFFKSLRKTLDYLENARADAENANKSKSNFLATMSHEIRTPLNAIIGIAQVQLQKEDLPQDYGEVMDKIYTSGSNLLMIINDILDLSKLETGKLELLPDNYDTPSLINDTVLLNIVRIGSKKIKFLLEVDETLPGVLYGDELRVKQILNNLISNAIKYTKEGHVKLIADHTMADGDVELRFRVEDTGQGITPDDQKWLFDEYARFNTRSNISVEGSGLGLNITQKLVEMMDGTISVESEYGRGSIFTVTIRQKAVECDAIGAQTVEKLKQFTFTDESHSFSHVTYEPMPYGRVLIVDDIDVNLYVAEAVLKPYQLNIELAESGYAAIEKVRDGGVYDIIFMDHMMPGMDGIAATENLRGMGYTGTIIALTANALVGNDTMFIEHGFDGFIAKPIDIHNIDDVLNTYIRDKRKQD